MRSARFGGVHSVILSSSLDLRLAWPHHQEEVSRGVRLNRVDETEIWSYYCAILESFDVRSTVYDPASSLLKPFHVA